MKLFYSVNSPYARKARIVLREKGLMDRVEEIIANPLENPPELIAVNPLCKIPALVLDNGETLCDSPLICEYLDSLNPDPQLHPSGVDRWQALGIAALADGILDAAVGCVVDSRKPEEQRSAEWKQRYESAILRSLEMLAGRIPEKTAPLTIALINMAVALGYISFRLPHIDWRRNYPALERWFKAFSARPSVQETLPYA